MDASEYKIESGLFYRSSDRLYRVVVIGNRWGLLREDTSVVEVHGRTYEGLQQFLATYNFTPEENT